ncbi:hypothetical protein WJX81_002288 [Elliptochloris bilobata]|uniref:Anaphase-promoting complex subunit 4 WD40 domain-containing protein n=1 Tax=Elliptochloris bilobata TaxID=381761 RepID=A0AAW1RFW5_9CHLO
MRRKQAGREQLSQRVQVEEAQGAPAKPGVSLKQLLKESSRAAAKGKHGTGAPDKAALHPLHVNTLKGHQGAISGVAFSADGAALATVCEDRALRIYRMDDIADPGLNFRRRNLLQTPVGVAAGDAPGQVAVLVEGRGDTAGVEMLGIGSGSGEAPAWAAADVLRGQAPLCLCSGTGASGRGVLLAAAAKTRLAVLDARSGAVLASLDSAGLVNHGAALSADGRLFAAATFTADVKVHEVKLNAGGDFISCAKVMDLKGHKSQVQAVAFSPDGAQAATASRDGTWCVWGLGVRHWLQEDAKKVLQAGQGLPPGACFQQLAFGPGSVVAAAAPGGELHFLDTRSGHLLEVVDAHEGDIACMQWSPVQHRLGGSRVAVLATGAGDKRVRLWRAPRV